MARIIREGQELEIKGMTGDTRLRCEGFDSEVTICFDDGDLILSYDEAMKIMRGIKGVTGI